MNNQVTGPPGLEPGIPVPKTGVLPITPRANYICNQTLYDINDLD